MLFASDVHGGEHYAEGGAVGEVVGPADEVRGQRIAGLLDRLAEDQRAEAREDFEQWHLRDADAAHAPGVGVDEGEAEDIVGDCAEQAGERAEDDGAPQAAVAAGAIENCDAVEQNGAGEKDRVEKGAHVDEVVHLGEQAPDRRGGEAENENAAGGGPLEEGGQARVGGGGIRHSVII